MTDATGHHRAGVVSSSFCRGTVSSAGNARHERKKDTMIILGVILIVLGIVLSIPVLYTIGVILAIIGVILWVLGSMGRAVGGRNHYY